MQVKELGHLVLYVRDIDRSARFYGEVLGWKRVSPPGLPVAAFSSGRTHHELLLIQVGEDATPIPQGRRIGLYHFGLKVADSDDELRDVLEQLQRHGVKLVGTADHRVTHSLYIEDPDGNEIELYSDVADADWRNQPELLLAPVRPLSL